jgi:osmotically-inducible protein OsmY
MRYLKQFRLVSSTAAAVIALGVGGCSTNSSSNKHDERSEGRVVDDKQVKENVQKGLDRDSTYKFTSVEVTTFGGVVQLSGFVNTEDQKRRAGDIAQQTPGAREVVNGIALKPEPMAPTGSTNGVPPRIYSE